MSFDVIQQRKDTRTVVFVDLQIKLPNKPGTHILKAKVDTGAEGNTLLCVHLCKMFPNKIDSLEQPLHDAMQEDPSVQIANNESSITQHSSVGIQYPCKGKWTTLKFFVVTTECPTVIGLPSLRDLVLITIQKPDKRNKRADKHVPRSI